ncbi:conserved hypothetical protein [Trichinella spiralis]|uniref:hypothetical protein n=1 Tax=Trichinella spiralis TaxID=6334 RepID=UPI0001EFB6D9|nr:conserved hypothetical protein [Trichinella spiralis]
MIDTVDIALAFIYIYNLERQLRYLERPSPNSSYWFSSRSLAFFFHRLQPCEIEYSAFERELLATSLAIRWLEIRRLTILTHHKPIVQTAQRGTGTHNPTHVKSDNWTTSHPSLTKFGTSKTRACMAARSEKPQETIWVAPTWTCNINVKEDRRWRKAIPSVLMSVVQMHNVQFDLPLNELCYRHSVSFLPSVEIMHDH